MNELVFHVVSGQAFFSGIGLMCLALLSSLTKSAVLARLSLLVSLVGLIFIASSSTPIPYGWYVLLFIFWAIWLNIRHQADPNRRMAALLICFLFGLAGAEAIFLLQPQVTPIEQRRITIIGDSVTAGLGDDASETTWPNLLAEAHQLDVQDISHVGDTAATALQRVKLADTPAELAIIEIGGNDLFGKTTPSEFAADLTALIEQLNRPGRQLLMFELPLPPFFHEYGRIQRNVARRFGVKLIPKRILLRVLARGEATLDSIHLSQAGHQAMADQVWRIIGPAIEGASAFEKSDD